jgi:hypothetical protein
VCNKVISELQSCCRNFFPTLAQKGGLMDKSKNKFICVFVIFKCIKLNVATLHLFFQVRSVVNDTRQNIDFASLDLHVVLQEFSSIS